MHWIPVLLVLRLYMFRAAFLPIIRCSQPYIGCGKFYAVVMAVCSQCHPAPGSKRSSQLHKMYQSRCKAKNSWWWAERLPETCRFVIPIKYEFSASLGFIHKEFLPSVTDSFHIIVNSLFTTYSVFWHYIYKYLRRWRRLYVTQQ